MARFLKIKVLGVSIITDTLQPIGATQIITHARKAEPQRTRLIRHIVKTL